jgi:hypothetical protein
MLCAMERLTLAEAARRGGTTPAILRRRAQRGTLAGAVKVDGAWYVEAPAGAPGQDVARPAGPPDGVDTGARWPQLVAALHRRTAGCEKSWRRAAAKSPSCLSCDSRPGEHGRPP